MKITIRSLALVLIITTWGSVSAQEQDVLHLEAASLEEAFELLTAYAELREYSENELKSLESDLNTIERHETGPPIVGNSDSNVQAIAPVLPIVTRGVHLLWKKGRRLAPATGIAVIASVERLCLTVTFKSSDDVPEWFAWMVDKLGTADVCYPPRRDQRSG